MKHKIAVLLAAVVCLLAFAPAQSDAQINISLGDRPYYNQNPYYVRNSNRYLWIPGHYVYSHHHRVWRHGHWRSR